MQSLKKLEALVLPAGARKLAVGGAIAALLGGAANAGLVATISDLALKEGPASHWQIAQFLALLLVNLGGSAIALALITRLSQGSVHHIRMDLCRRILNTPLRKLESVGVAKLFATLTDDVSSIADATYAVPTLLSDCAILIGCMIYLCWLSPLWFAVTVGVLAVGVLTYLWIARHGSVKLDEAREAEDVMLAHYRTLTDGAKELKLHSRRRAHFVDELLETASTTLRDRHTSGLMYFLVAHTWTQLLFFSAIGAALFGMRAYGATGGTAAAFVLTLIYLFTPLTGVVGLVPNLAGAMVALKKIASLDLEAPAPVLAAVRHQDAWQQLSLRDIVFSYQDQADQFVLGPIDLDVAAGEIVFIVGGNGSGKSTFARVLTGLYPADGGQILVNGKAVLDTDLAAYRENFSAIFADFWLFEHVLGHDDPGELDQQATEYLKLFELTDKLNITNGQFSTTALSTGQRKRLALLSAMLDPRPIYLFDEWAADQDPRFRDIFYRELLPLLRDQGKGIIVISHDERYFSEADRILRLDRGQLVAVDIPHRQRPAAVAASSALSLFRP